MKGQFKQNLASRLRTTSQPSVGSPTNQAQGAIRSFTTLRQRKEAKVDAGGFSIGWENDSTDQNRSLKQGSMAEDLKAETDAQKMQKETGVTIGAIDLRKPA